MEHARLQLSQSDRTGSTIRNDSRTPNFSGRYAAGCRPLHHLPYRFFADTGPARLAQLASRRIIERAGSCRHDGRHQTYVRRQPQFQRKRFLDIRFQRFSTRHIRLLYEQWQLIYGIPCLSPLGTSCRCSILGGCFATLDLKESMGGRGFPQRPFLSLRIERIDQ